MLRPEGNRRPSLGLEFVRRGMNSYRCSGQ
jgi:hypothetical protein